jgi:hypothetical protein
MRRIVFVGLLTCFACQRYVALDVAPSLVGSDVRVNLNGDAAAVTFSHIGSRVRQAEGRVLAESDSTLSIGVTGVTRLGGFEDSWAGDTVVFQRSEITGVEKKEVSRSRTLLSVAAFVLGGILAHGQLAGGEGGAGGQTHGGGGN